VTRYAKAAAISELDRLIPPEIVGDRFFRTLERIAAAPGVRTILEIGSSSGEGSTAALVSGALRNDPIPQIHCIEVSIPRFNALVRRYSGFDFVHCHNVSSVPLESFPQESAIDAFRARAWTRLRLIRRSEIMRWLHQDIEYVQRHGLSGEGIRAIARSYGIDAFDAVVIDGSEFTGPADLDRVYGARFIALDDVRTFKNYDNLRTLDADPGYRRIAGSRWLRNGFAVFERTHEAGAL